MNTDSLIDKMKKSSHTIDIGGRGEYHLTYVMLDEIIEIIRTASLLDTQLPESGKNGSRENLTSMNTSKEPVNIEIPHDRVCIAGRWYMPTDDQSQALYTGKKATDTHDVDDLQEAVNMAHEARKYLLERPANKVKCNIMLLRLVAKFSKKPTDSEIVNAIKKHIGDLVNAHKREPISLTYSQLEHEYHSTRGLWCIDRDPKEVTHEWIKRNAFQLEEIT